MKAYPDRSASDLRLSLSSVSLSQDSHAFRSDARPFSSASLIISLFSQAASIGMPLHLAFLF